MDSPRPTKVVARATAVEAVQVVAQEAPLEPLADSRQAKVAEPAQVSITRTEKRVALPTPRAAAATTTLRTIDPKTETQLWLQP